MILRHFSVLLLALALPACGSGNAPEAADGANAQGEIQGGTISDAMLPLDDLKSQSPPMKPAPGESGAATAPGSEGTESTAEDTEDTSEAAPAEADEPAEPAEEG